MTDTDRVLTTLKRLRHFAKREFILQVVNETQPQLEMRDVSISLENLHEDGLIENRVINGKSYWRANR